MRNTLRTGLGILLLLALLPGPRGEAAETRASGALGAARKLAIPGDFNNDFQPDLLFQSPDGDLVVELMEGFKPAGLFTANPSGMAEKGWQASGTADFDADGYTDVLWFSPRTGAVAIWHMQGLDFVYQTELSERVTDATPVSIFDFDNDGRPDLLLQTTSGELVVYLLSGDDVVAKVPVELPPTTGSRDTRWTAAGAGDFDGDGDADIVLTRRAFSPCTPAPACADTASDLVAVALRSGTSTKLVVITQQPDRNWRIGAVADYNGDSNPDLILYNTLTRQTAAWVMEGLKIRLSMLITDGAPGVIVGPR